MKNNDIRSRIINTAAELFIMQDFSAVSIRNISEHAAVNISSIYYYYESKVDLLENLLLQAEQSFNRVLSTKHLNTPAQLFQSLFDLYYTKILNNEKPTLIFFYHRKGYNIKRINDIIIRIENRISNKLESILDHYRNKNLLVSGISNFAIVTYFLAIMTEAAYLKKRSMQFSSANYSHQSLFDRDIVLLLRDELGKMMESIIR